MKKKKLNDNFSENSYIKDKDLQFGNKDLFNINFE